MEEVEKEVTLAEGLAASTSTSPTCSQCSRTFTSLGSTVECLTTTLADKSRHEPVVDVQVLHFVRLLIEPEMDGVRERGGMPILYKKPVTRAGR